MNSHFQIVSFILTGMWDEMGSKTLERSEGDWPTYKRPSNELTKFPIPSVVKNVATPCVSWPGIGREFACCCGPCWTPCVSWPAIGREFSCCCGLWWTVDVDGPHIESADRLNTSYKGRSVGRVSLWDASISDAIGIFSPCGTAVVWPFRFGVVFCLFDVEIFCWNPFFGGFRSLFGGFILFGSWMALILFWFLLNIFVRTPLSTEQPGQSEG